MGLDMYLYRMPRYKDATARDVENIENYCDWKKNKEDPKSSYKHCTLKEWCGVPYKDLNKDFLKYYKQFYHIHYYEWDKDHKYPSGSIKEEVGYWRKANAIHDWFVENVQDGIDDCHFHNEVTKTDIENLLNKCFAVLNTVKLENGSVKNGKTFENGEWHDNIEDGIVIANSSEIEKILPSCSGFFFGSTDYDNYYLEEIKETIDICEKVLSTTNFEKEMIYYCSSW